MGGGAHAQSSKNIQNLIFKRPEMMPKDGFSISNRYIKKFVGTSAAAMRNRAQNTYYEFQNTKPINNLMDEYRAQLNDSYGSSIRQNHFVFDETTMGHYMINDSKIDNAHLMNNSQI